MKRWTSILFLVMGLCLCLKAQDYQVVKVEHLPNDMSAREEIMKDENDRQCALLRVATKDLTPEQRQGFFFECDFASYVVERRLKDGEIWLWVSPGLKTLKIIHNDLGRYELQLATTDVGRIQPLNVYKILIQGTFKPGAEAKTKPKKQFLAFQIVPANATLEVNDQLWSVDAEGGSMKYVDFGTYTYKVRASDYFTEKGQVTVDDPDNTKIVPITLKPNFAEVTLKVDADVEIWVNNEKKGVRTWKGPLGAGTYKVECKQVGYETSETVVEITNDMSGTTITLNSPKPLYGSLMVMSTPNFCKLFIDGKEMGTTPKSINEILVGGHEIKLTKNGYSDHVETVTIAKDEQKQVSATLQAISKPETPKPQPQNGNGTYNGHEYVDLGLPSGTLWATCNVGVSKPEEYGNYYAWGETTTKNTYNWSAYNYCNGLEDKLTKYCNQKKYDSKQFTDNLTVLQPGDDAATISWGSGWCIPTKAQWEELKSNTTATWTTQNGVNGFLFQAPNGNSLFLPATGYRNESGLYNVGDNGYYWSSTLYTDNPYYAKLLYFNSVTYVMNFSSRSYGLPVRAVRSVSQN